MNVLRQQGFIDPNGRSMNAAPIDPEDRDADLVFLREQLGALASNAFRLHGEDGPGFFLYDGTANPNPLGAKRPVGHMTEVPLQWYWLGFIPERGHFIERLLPMLRAWLESYDERESFIAVLKRGGFYRAYDIAPEVSKPSHPAITTSRMN